MATTFTPMVFTLGPQTVLTDPKQIIAYTLRHFINAPASVSDIYRNMTISLPDIISNYGSDRATVSKPIITQLTGALSRIFGNTSTVTIDVDIEDPPMSSGKSGSRYYSVGISVRVQYNGMIYSCDPSITVNANGQLVLASDSIDVMGTDISL